MRTAVVGSISLMNIVIYLNILNTKYTKYLNTPTGASTNLKNFDLNKHFGLCLFQNMFHNLLLYTNKFCFGCIAVSCFYKALMVGWP